MTEEQEPKFAPRRPTSGDLWPIDTPVITINGACNNHSTSPIGEWSVDFDRYLSITERDIAGNMEKALKDYIGYHAATGCHAIPRIEVTSYSTRSGILFNLSNLPSLLGE